MEKAKKKNQTKKPPRMEPLGLGGWDFGKNISIEYKPIKSVEDRLVIIENQMAKFKELFSELVRWYAEVPKTKR